MESKGTRWFKLPWPNLIPEQLGWVGHLFQPLKKGHVFTHHPKKVSSRIARIGYFISHSLLEHFLWFLLLSCCVFWTTSCGSTFNLRLFPRGSSCLVWGARLLGRSRYFQSQCQGCLSLGVCCCIFVFVWRGGKGVTKMIWYPGCLCMPFFIHDTFFIYTQLYI